MNKTNKTKKTRREEHTPIIDGDARPDMPIDPKHEENQKREKENKHTTSRAADVDKSENYKDAKI